MAVILILTSQNTAFDFIFMDLNLKYWVVLTMNPETTTPDLFIVKGRKK